MASSRIAGITIEIGGDTTKLVQALSSVDKAVKQTQTNLRDINKALKFDPGNTALLKDKQVELGNAINETKQKLEAEKQALEQMQNAPGFDKTSEQARNLKTQIDLDTAALKELEAQARSASSVLGTQMQLAGQKIQEIGNKIQNVGSSISNLGRDMTAKITVPIVGAFGASVKAAVDWETAFTGVQKTVNASAKEYDQLAQNIRKMATETASSKEDIAGVMEIAGQLGIEGVDGLTTFTKTMVELGDTTNLTAEEAATSLARFMNITGESASDVDRIGSAVVDLGNNFATSESEIVEMATRLASAGTIAGMTSTDILALAASMSSVGIQAEAGGTAMTQTLEAMTKAVANFEDGSTEDLEKIAEVANMSANDFAKAWNENPIMAVQNFISGLGQLDSKGKNATLVLDELGMSGIRQSNMLKSLSLASGVLSDAIETSSAAYEKNNALSEEAEKRYATMAAKMSQLKERFKDVAINVGEILMPYIEKLMTKLEELVDKWNSLSDAEKEQIIRFAAIAAAIGPLLMVIGSLVSSVGSIVSVVGGAVKGIGSLMTAAGGLQGVFAALTGPIGVAVAAVAALSAGFVYLYNTNENFKSSMDQTIALLQNNLVGSANSVIATLQQMGEAFAALATTCEPVLQAIATLIAGAFNGIILQVQTVSQIVTQVITAINAAIQAFLALRQGDFQGFFDWLMVALAAFGQGMLSTITLHLQGINGILQAFGINISAWFTNQLNQIKTIVTNANNAIKSGVQSALEAIKNITNSALTTIKNKYNEIFEAVRKGVTEKMSQVKSAIKNGMEDAASYLKSLPSQALKWGADIIKGLIDGIKSKIGALKSAMNEVASAISEKIHFSEPDVGPLKDFHTYMPDMMDELVNGINAGVPKVAQAMNGLASSMIPEFDIGGQGATNNTVNITVYGAQGQSVTELADIIEQKIADNTIRRGVAYG